MSGVRVEVPMARLWPRPVSPAQQQNDVSDLAERPFEIGPRLPKVIRPADNWAARVPLVSNEQASSALSLFTTAMVIVAASAFAGTAYEFTVDQDYHDLSDFLATGLLIAVIFCGARRLSEERQPMKLSHVYGRARDAFVAWITTFAVFLGTFSLDTAAIDTADTIGWSFTVADSAMDSLKAGATKVQLYDVTISDGHGGTIIQTITITLTGADDAAATAGRTRKARANAQEANNTSDGAAYYDRHDVRGDDSGPASHHTAPDLVSLVGAHLNLHDYSGA
jgi:VCBS repeat-containing protein